MKRIAYFTLLSLFFALSVAAFEPGSYDINMQAGEDYKLTLKMSDLNLTGNTYAAQFRSAPAPAGIVFATYSARRVTGTTDQVEVKLSKVQTLANSGKTGVWDLKQIDANGLVSYLLTGKATVKPTVTR